MRQPVSQLRSSMVTFTIVVSYTTSRWRRTVSAHTNNADQHFFKVIVLISIGLVFIVTSHISFHRKMQQ